MTPSHKNYLNKQNKLHRHAIYLALAIYIIDCTTKENNYAQIQFSFQNIKK